MENKKLGIIGHFGGEQNILDGQTIKTKILYEELNKITKWEIIKVDTYYKRSKPFKLLKDSFSCLKKTEDIIVLLSGRGMRFYFPLLFLCAKAFGTNVYHDVIGGNLDTYVKKYPKFRKYLNSFKVNWVETNGLRNKLEKCGIKNCEVIPNFKRLEIVEIREEVYDEPFRFCIFSRVMKEKGIEIAIDAIQNINLEAKRIVCELDIYGRVDDGYKENFEKIMSTVTNAVKYKGMVPYDRSVETIKEYYALLFPTYWKGEGFPGTIVDAFSAGIPVIGTDWNCNGEIINSGKNGILYPNKEIKDLEAAVKWMIEHKEDMNEFKANCIQDAEKYQPDRYIKKIVRKISNEEY